MAKNRNRTKAQAREEFRRAAKARATNPQRGVEDVTAELDGEFAPDVAGAANGQVERDVKGSMFEWNTGLFYDPERGAMYDRGEYEARDYAMMLRTYHKARALESVLTLPIRSATWKLVPGQGDTGEAEQTEEQLRRPPATGGMSTPITTVVGQMTNAFSMRRSFHAKGLKLDPARTDGTVMWSQLAHRPATTCRLLRDPQSGELRGFEQDLQFYTNVQTVNQGLPIPFTRAQSMIYIHGAHRDPVGGVSDMEIVYWCWKTQQKLLYLWLTYLEGVALPRTIVGYNGGDEGKARQVAIQIAQLKSSGVGYIDTNNMELNTLDLSGKGPAGFTEAIRYLDMAASGSVMASFTDLGAAADSSGGARGSYALSKDQTDFFLQGREAVARELAECLTSEAVAPLVKMNYGDRGVCPQWAFDPLAGVDEQPVIALLTAVASGTATALPPEFVSEIIVEAARILSLDVEKVTAAVEKSQKLAEAAAEAAGANPLGQQVAGVNGAVTKLTNIASTTKTQEQA